MIRIQKALGHHALSFFATQSTSIMEVRTMEGLQKLLEDPMNTLYSFVFLFAFVAIIFKYLIKGDDKNDK